MSVADLKPYLVEHWPHIRDLLADRYQPQAVRGVEIPKPGGGMRQLVIPTVVDRLIQQAMHQVLTPLFDPSFSPHSYGFRAGRRAHDAPRPRTRAKRMMRRWLTEERAWASAYNGRDPWWNAGASHMNDAIRANVFAKLGQPSLLMEHRRLNRVS